MGRLRPAGCRGRGARGLGSVQRSQLTQTGDRWKAEFDGAPADFLSISFAPPNNYAFLKGARFAMFYLSLGAAFFACSRLRRSKWGKARWNWLRWLLAPTFLAVFAAGNLLALASLQVLATDPGQIARAYRLGLTEPMYNGFWLGLHLIPLLILYLVVRAIQFLLGLTRGKRDRPADAPRKPSPA